jgi:ABC-2 type transport system permease protein
MLAIYKKELRSYFTSMIGYVFMSFFLVVIGIYFFAQNLLGGYANFEYTLSSISFIFVLLAPILTMRLMAEENKQKTDQLLYTSPLSASSIIMGKFLAVFTIFLGVILIISTYPMSLSKYGDVKLSTAYASVLGFALLGGAYLSMGLLISSLTDSQVVAAVISFVVFLFTALMEGIANIIPSDNRTAYIVFSAILLLICYILYRMMHNVTVSIAIACIGEAALTITYLIKPAIFDGSVSRVFTWFSVLSRFDSFYYGILDLTSIVYYFSIIFVFLYLSTQVIKKKRWS